MNSDGITSFTVPELSARWFLLPPFVAVGTFVLVRFFAGDGSAPVDAAIWGMTVFLFIVLTVLYGIFIQKNFRKGFLPLQLAAQGLLLCPLSLYMGARMLQWVGVTLAVCGAVGLVVLYCRSFSAFAAVVQTTAGASSEIDSLPIPIAVTDGEGAVFSVSDTLLQMTQQSREAVIGQTITLLVSLDGEPMKLGGKEWNVVQSHTPDGKYYFQLEEARLQTLSAAPLSAANSPAATDEELYDRAHAARCTTEEMYRVRRYKRWMSAALLRVVFQGNNPPEKEEEIFHAYSRFVKESIRETDIACLVAPRDIYVLMPETPLEGARIAVGKLTDFRSHIQAHLSGFEGTVEVRDKTIFLGPSGGEVVFDEIMEKLNNALGTPDKPAASGAE
jgi:PAS domain-containing protein